MKSFLIILLTLILSACSNLVLVENANSKQQLLENINPGEVIHIETHDGQKHIFEVESVDTNSVKGEGKEVQLNDIKKLEIEEPSALKTAGFIYFVAPLLVGILFVI